MSKIILGLAGIALFMSGCFARGGVAGELRHNVDAPVGTAHTAVVETYRIEKITIAENKSDEMSALVKGFYADETQVTVECRLLTQQATEIVIQVGLFGDKFRSQALLKSILERLEANQQ